ncbi:hypothetical protein QUF64_13375 [Anaerolineales bacterium HSG6]|nr:hypothetical protein [Anaerolineales bacterium HSG6]MDM8532418.1 hypothetical protein [Anaerolineales bacterium HSG25]
MTSIQDPFELQTVADCIKNDLNLEYQLIERSILLPLDSLVIVLEPDSDGQARATNIMFIPLDDADYRAIKLLQFYTELPLILDEQGLTNIEPLLRTINLYTPIGTFSLNDQKQIIFKYVYILGKFNTINSAEFVEMFSLWLRNLDTLSRLIKEVARAEKTVEQALNTLS